MDIVHLEETQRNKLTSVKKLSAKASKNEELFSLGT